MLKPILAAMLISAPAAAQAPLTPLFWTQGQPPDVIRKVIREVAQGGNTGLVWESRPHPDYLGAGWWRDLEVAIDESKKQGLALWLFDEWMYPSGIAGGKVVSGDPELANHVIEARTAEPAINEPFRLVVPGGLGAGESLVSVVAFRKGADPVDLAGRESWTPPGEGWKVCWVVSRAYQAKAGWEMDNMIDVMNPRAAEAFIRLTHEPTYARFGSEFGKTIRGFFSDETGFRNVTSYRSLPGMAGMPMPWSPVFVDYFQKRKGYDPRPLLAALWWDLGAKGRAARFDLMDAYTRAFAENFFRPQQEWCRAHGVEFIGHVVEDNHADHNLGYGPGHWFRVMQYFDVPGIDVVGYQVTPGLDAGQNFWTPEGEQWDQEHFQFGLAAMARGAALAKRDRRIFSEAFGANGWSEGLRMVKWIGDWHIVNGIAFLSPHAVTMKHHDPDCPPHFNESSGNPQARYYVEWAKYFRKLQALVWENDPVYDAAVLYTAESAWVGPAQNVAPVVRALEQTQVSTVVLPYEIWAKEGSFDSGAWSYNGQRFRAVVLPRVQAVPVDAIRRLAEFARAGGRVIVVDEWPRLSVDGRGDGEVAAAVENLRAKAALLSLPELARAASDLARVRPDAAAPWLQVSRRRGPTGEFAILHNRSLTATVRVLGQELPPYALAAVDLSTRRALIEPPLRIEGQALPVSGWDRALGDWRRQPGLDKFAGTMTYKATVRLEPGGRVVLDAGEVYEIAELTVNGKPAGVRIAPPYRWEVGSLVRGGENTIEIAVTNTAQARWADPFSRGDALSGLYGPVAVYVKKR
jgi:hypothetical protein